MCIRDSHLTTLTAAIEFQRSKLELVAMEAMITLCSDPISKTIKGSPDISVLVSFDISGLLCWIDALFNSSNKSIRSLGVRALRNLLENNGDSIGLYKDALVQCSLHNADVSVTELYYSTVCESILKMETLILPEEDLIALGLYGVFLSLIHI